MAKSIKVATAQLQTNRFSKIHWNWQIQKEDLEGKVEGMEEKLASNEHQGRLFKV